MFLNIQVSKTSRFQKTENVGSEFSINASSHPFAYIPKDRPEFKLSRKSKSLLLLIQKIQVFAFLNPENPSLCFP